MPHFVLMLLYLASSGSNLHILHTHFDTYLTERLICVTVKFYCMQKVICKKCHWYLVAVNFYLTYFSIKPQRCFFVKTNH